MADLGERGNVMGPQPIANRKAPPAAMLEAAERVLNLLAAHKDAELAAMAAPAGAREIAEVAQAMGAQIYDRHEVIATAHVNRHYYVKARLTGSNADPFTVQFRLGERDGEWAIWEAVNLTSRTAWTR